MSTLQGKPWYAEAGGYEDDGPTNFEAPTTGAFLENQRKANKRLREARAGELAVRSGRLFHEKEASRYGLDSARGLAHLRASRMLKTSSGKFSKMFEDDATMGAPSPKAQMKVCQAAAAFHKQKAQEAGPESDLGQAHIQQMQTHLSNASQIKQQGQQQKQTPFPVPDKKSVPNKDVKQQGKAPIQLPPDAANQGGTRKLQQGQEAGKTDAAKGWGALNLTANNGGPIPGPKDKLVGVKGSQESNEGGPGSGRHSGGKSPSTPEEHKQKISRDTMKMPDAMAGVMGGPNKSDAAYNLGKDAHARGDKAVPIHDKHLRLENGPVGTNKAALTSWLKGWHDANLAKKESVREAARSIKIENFGQADAERTPKAYKPKTVNQQVGSDLLLRQKDDGIEMFPNNPTNAKTMMTSRRSLRRSA